MRLTTRLPLVLAVSAFLLAAVAGCGDDNANPVDAPAPPDAAVDAPAPVDAPPVDAAPPAFSDAGIYTTPVTPGQIQCGILLTQLCNLDTTRCCFNPGAANLCPPASAEPDAGACLFDMTCDGPEDCPNGQSC